jgi:chemotaxis methyl-accepting protein methylase
MSANEANSPLQFEGLLDYVHESRGFDFTAYKRSSLERRIQKRMQAANVEDYGGYCDFLEAHPSEFTLLFNTILINVTSFFRDPEVWEYLATDIDSARAREPRGRRVRPRVECGLLVGRGSVQPGDAAGGSARARRLS